MIATLNQRTQTMPSQVISRGSASRMPDGNAYVLSKEAKWGDLWPAKYLKGLNDK
jgi:hypothetical protein